MTFEERFNWVDTTEGQKFYYDWMKKLCDKAGEKINTNIHMMDNGEYFVYIRPSEKMKEYLLKRNPTVDFSSDSTRVKIYFTVKNTIIAQLKIIVRRYEKGLYDGIPLITLYEKKQSKRILKRRFFMQKNTFLNIIQNNLKK